MSQVLGKDFIGLIKVGDDWIPYVCSTAISINATTEAIETSGPGNGLWATYAPTKNSFSAQAAGVVSLNEVDLTIVDLRALQFAQTVFLMRYQRTAADGSTYTEEGYCFITNSSDSGNYDGANTFSIQFQGTGPLTQLTYRILAETGDFLITEDSKFIITEN